MKDIREMEIDDDNDINPNNDKHASKAIDRTKNSVPTVAINLRAAAGVLCPPDSFPQPLLKISVEFDKECDGPPRMVDFPSGTKFHPLLLDLEDYLNLVNDKLFGKESDGIPKKFCFFTSFKHLKELLEIGRISDDNDGSWKDMLMWGPGLKRINVVFEYPAYFIPPRNYALLGESGGGVTMGQLVRAFPMI